MRLKMYIWHNQVTDSPEVLYEFPWSEASANEISLYGREMYSRKPLEKPVLNISECFLTKIKNTWYEVPNEILHKHLLEKHYE